MELMRFSLPLLTLVARARCEAEQVCFPVPATFDTRTAQPQIVQNATGIIFDPLKVANQSYDYVIAGGGLTGLTIASQLLHQRPNLTVLVIESGFDTPGGYDPIIRDLNTYGKAFGSSVDHAFETSLQVNNRVELIRSGNGLGGSTLINGGTWTRPHKDQIDSWEKDLGNTGWTWNNLRPYMDQVERPRDPKDDNLTPHHSHSYDPTCHGTMTAKGLVDVGARDTKVAWSPLIKALMTAANQTTGAPSKLDLCCGRPHGVSMFLNSLDRDQNRTDAARELLKPLLMNDTLRARITVLTGQLVGKVNLQLLNPGDANLANRTSASTVKYRATGVEFGTNNEEGWKFNITAKHEVLLAAGSAMSPLILQYSGIGPEHLYKEDGINIEPNLYLPVGLNLQDQTTTSLVAQTNSDGNGQGQAAYFATFSEIIREDATTFQDLLASNDTLMRWAKQTALYKQYLTYRNWLLSPENISYAELFMDTDNTIHFDIWTLLPFTRGYTKILHHDPYLRHFEYNPRYFENELDLMAQAAATRLARTLTRHTAMKNYYKEETIPGDQVVHEGASLADWSAYVKQTYRPNYHCIGTCSMMMRELGGVVDPTAKVYGVQNLRVVDGSIPPTQVSSHVMTVFYAMALKIADAILKGFDNNTSR
ncbi:glucose oxidase [Aspergillus carlsbadensis]|nr:glucose oxidase [Aspergillus carlsbadensis]